MTNNYKELLDKDQIPQHVAIIMDGNGRWAKLKGHPRNYGHQAGVDTVRKITETAVRMGIKYLTLYTFSTENWNRPEEEVNALMELLFKSIEDDIFKKNEVGFRVIGNMERLPENVQEKLKECMENTKNYKRMCLVLALSYSSKWEITNAVRCILNKYDQGFLTKKDISEDLMNKHMTTNFMPDPDLLIRTGGEIRLSNFLLWQCAYSELYFCDTYWPDFNEKEFYKAIYSFQQRQRRYGKTSEQIENE